MLTIIFTNNLLQLTGRSATNFYWFGSIF